jgi:hypothetical protein
MRKKVEGAQDVGQHHEAYDKETVSYIEEIYGSGLLPQGPA